MNITRNYEDLMELEYILENEEIKTFYQPIVSLKNGEILGYEALSRGPKNSRLEFPDELFSAAKYYDKTWELELLCRVKAIERARKIKKDKLLFINVDPHIFKDDKFEKGLTKEFLFENNISPQSIIFEITEKTAVKDYLNFRNAIENYTEQGYKIALDDIGAGYSGLNTLSYTKPHYVKVDMDLIRDINKDQFKQSILECLVKLSLQTNMKLIAEGIETEEELSTLIRLGVYAGQGYLLSKPQDEFVDISEKILGLIEKYNIVRESNLNLFATNYIGEIAIEDTVFEAKTSCILIKEYLDKEHSRGTCIVENNVPVGLVMREKLDAKLATQYGISVFRKRPISLIMDKKPLIVDYYESMLEVSKLAMDRGDDEIYDYVIVTKGEQYYGIVTVKSLLHHTTMLQCDYAKQLNPLTGLPGNLSIDRVLNHIINDKERHCILYFDLDNFKVYNDTYGFDNGDKIIIFTANIIQHEINKMFGKDGFVGHIGGDDFIFIRKNSYRQCEVLCENIISRFDAEIKNYFRKEHIECGYIEGKNRQGHLTKFPLTAISIAGISGTFKDTETISTLTASIKNKAKNISGNSYIIQEVHTE